MARELAPGFQWIVLALFLVGAAAPLHAQWQPNGLVLRDVVNHHMMLPAEDGGHWVIYDTPIDFEYFCGHVQKYDTDGVAQFPGYGFHPSISILYPSNHNFEITGAVLSDSGSIIVGFESTTLRAHVPDLELQYVCTEDLFRG